MASVWIGGGDDRANDPNDWSPTGVPLNTDAVISHGTMNIEGNALAPVANYKLIVKGDALLNLIRANHPQVAPNVRPIHVENGTATISVKDFSASFDLSTGHATGGTAGSAIVELVPFSSKWIGGFHVAGSLVVKGSFGASFISAEDSVVEHTGRATIQADIGNGTSKILDRGRLEIGGSVAAGQHFVVSGIAPLVDAHLELDHPNTFLGSIQIVKDAEIDLIGLTEAASYSMKNDLLSIYSADNTVIDTLKLSGGHPLTLIRGVAGLPQVSIFTTQPSFVGGFVLPQHG